MSLSEQTARVAGGGKNTLKAILQKLGVAVGDVPIDQYADLADQISEKLLPDNLSNAETAQLFGLDGTALVREILVKVSELLKSTDSEVSDLRKTKAKVVSGYYTGTGKSGINNPTSISFPDKPVFVAITGTASSSGAVLFNDFQGFSADNVSTEYQDNACIYGQYSAGGTRYYNQGKKSADGKTFYWYSPDPPSGYGADTEEAQKNKLGYKYFYFALIATEG